MEIRNTYLVRIWYVFASLNTHCVYLLRISGFSLRIFLWANHHLLLHAQCWSPPPPPPPPPLCSSWHASSSSGGSQKRHAAARQPGREPDPGQGPSPTHQHMRAATTRGLPPTAPIPTPPKVSLSAVSSSLFRGQKKRYAAAFAPFLLLIKICE